MTAPFLNHNFARRSGKTPKLHASAAYITATKIEDELGSSADYRPKGGVLAWELWLPEEAPPAYKSSLKEFCHQVKVAEDRSTRPENAIEAHKFIGALPCELSLEENTRLAKDFVRENFTRHGYAAIWAIHKADKNGDPRNLHLHLLVPLRKLGPEGFAKTKDRFPKNSPALSNFIRGHQAAFFNLQNRYLAKNGINAKIDRVGKKWTVLGETQQASVSTTTPYTPKTYSSPSSSPFFHAPPVPRPIDKNEQQDRTMPPQNQKSPPASDAQDKPDQDPNAWPKEAVEDWKDWGFLDPPLFFEKWQELASPQDSPNPGVPGVSP